MPVFPPDVLAAWTGGRWTRPPDRPIVGVRHETPAVVAGDLFVALRGERRDGHEFVGQAFALGAAAALVSEDFAAREGAAHPLLAVRDPRVALTAMARGHRHGCRAHVIGVTGSVGKTTVKEMVAAVLAEEGPVTCTKGNWNNDLGLPLSLLAMEPDDLHGVFEIGMNHPGELAPLCDLMRPDWGVMSRVGPAHIEFFENEEAIADEKATLLRALPEAGVALLAADEPWFERMRPSARCRVVTVALDTDADYRARRDVAARRFVVRERSGAEYGYPARMPGEAGVRNALRAVAVGRERGLSPGAIASALDRFRAPPMRGGVEEVGGLRWVNDAYNANSISMDASIDAFAESFCPGRKWLVLGGMRELGVSGEALHRIIGRRLAGAPWAGLIVKGALAEGIAAGALEAGFPADRIRRAGDAREAAAALVDAGAGEGDTVLVKGSRGERMEDVIREWSVLRGVAVADEGHRNGH